MENRLTSRNFLRSGCLAGLVSEYYAFDDLTYDDRLARQALLELINDERFGRIWLLELEKQPIGYLVLTFGFIVEFHGKHAVLDEVYLRPNYRVRGYFQLALGFVEAFCRELDVRCLRLEVEIKNDRAQESYRKTGFLQHERLLNKNARGRYALDCPGFDLC